MDGCVAEPFRNLREIQPFRPDQLFGCIDLHPREILYNACFAPLAEDLLELGAPDQVVVADLLDGEVAAYVVFKVIRNAAEYFIVAF